jgi:hypothetical protein
MDGTREGDDFLLRGFEIVLPQFGMTGKADPDGIVRRPFGGLAIVAHARADSDAA